MDIRKHRKKRNVSLRSLAEASGISPALLCGIENGKAPITAKSAQKLARAMGLREWWKLVRENPKEQTGAKA